MEGHENQERESAPYAPPTLVAIGLVTELTLDCDERYDNWHGFTFMRRSIVCSSA